MEIRFYNPQLDSPEVAMFIATRLKKIRKIENLSQQQLADKAYVSLYTIKKFEKTGECSFLTLIKIARALRYMDDFDKIFRFQDKYLKDYSYDAEQELQKKISKKRIKPSKKSETSADAW